MLMRQRAYLLFIGLTLVIFITQNLFYPNATIDGLLIPDSLIWSSIAQNPSLWAESPGTSVLYFFFGKLPYVAPLCINILLMTCSFVIMRDIFKHVYDSQTTSLAALVVNPYIYLAMISPNKEVPLILTTLLATAIIISKKEGWIPFLLLIALISALVRASHGPILVFTVILFIFFREKPKRMVVAGGVACLIINASMNKFFSAFNLVKSNLAVSKMMADSAGFGLPKYTVPLNEHLFLSPVSYIIRLLANMLTLATRPQMVTELGGISVSGVAYWIFGILLVVSMAACIYIFFMKDDAITLLHKQVAAIVLLMWFFTSLSSFNQPRYLMPVFPLAFGVYIILERSKTKIAIYSLVLILLIIAFFKIFSIKPPPLQEHMNNTPSFLMKLGN
jgi:hypothetical protein